MDTAPRARLVRVVLAAAVVAALAVGLTATGAEADEGGPPPRVLAEGLVGPLHLSDAGGGRTLVSQSFAGLVSVVERNGTVRNLVEEPGGFTGGAEPGPFGTVLYLVGSEAGAFLKVRLPWGTTFTLADLGTYEATVNPDRDQQYGLQGLDQACIDQLPPDIPGLAPYRGEVNSNPYEMVVTPFGVIVADAGANALLGVAWNGSIRTIAVLPPRPEVITPEAAAAAGLPDCVGGATLNFEPVPTDVEIADWTTLYVSSLPGGPEDASLGPRGGVFRVNPWTGGSELIATGFLGATNLAVAPNGTIYVTELFGNRLSKVVNGGSAPVADLDEPAAVEWSRGRLLVTTDVNTSGRLVELRP